MAPKKQNKHKTASKKKTSESSLQTNAGSSSSEHSCNKNPDAFCYICSKYHFAADRRQISGKIKSIYKNCFGINVSNQDKKWTPHKICNACYMMMTRYVSDKESRDLKFVKPACWKEPSCEEDCYICMTKVTGINRKNIKSLQYPEVPTLVKPVEKNTDIDDERASSIASMESMSISDNSNINEKKEEKEDEEEEEASDDGSASTRSEYYVTSDQDKAPKTINQEQMNDLVRDLGLPKDKAEFLASYMKHNNWLSKGTRVSYYRNREENFRKYFTKIEEPSLVYCNNVEELMNELQTGIYKDDEWRLFIDSSKQSLKAVLLHNTNVLAPIPIAHSTVLKEEYSTLKFVLETIKYSEHNWLICGDLKILTILLGQQSGYTKYPCFLCLWDSRDRANHYIKKTWPDRTSLQAGSANMLHEPLVDHSKVLLPPLHIKLGLMKQYVKALDKEGECFKYLKKQFPKLSDAKITEGIFDGPQIRKMLRDDDFISTMTDKERAAWISFKEVVQNFLGNHKSVEYKEIVARMVENYKELGCLMNLKLHYLHSHIDYFPMNLGDFSEEQGERFHQDIKTMEIRYQGRWDVNMIADYCWSLKRESNEKGVKRKRKPLVRSFQNKKVRYHKKQ